MNDIKVFTNEQYDELKGLKKSSPYIGFVYILEWGNKTKIGWSTNPSKRINQLKKTALYGGVDIGRIAITPGHTNYWGIENFLHKYYAKHRIEGTELFNLGFDEILNSLPVLLLEDESQMLCEKENAITNLFKNTVLGIYETDNVRCPVCGEICDTIYMDRNGNVFACDKCVIDQDSCAWDLEKRNRHPGGVCE